MSAGYRVGKTAPASLVALYEQVVGPYPAPANRRTWIVLRADPEHSRKSSQRRESGVAGLARYLVASTTRIADQLASNGIDARPIRSFDDFDHATEISFERETWSAIKGRSTFTAAYSAAGGPDVWWSARADHTITRVRIRPGVAPTATVLLTTLANPTYTARVFVSVRRPACCTAGHQPGHRPPLRVTDRVGGRAGRRDGGPLPGVHAVRRRRRQHQPRRRAAVHPVRGAIGRGRCGGRRSDRSSASSPASSTDASGRWPRCRGRTPRHTWVRIPASAEWCCGTTSSTRRAIASCRSG